MTEKKSLGNQIISGSFWIVVLEISNQILQFVKTFYAATILTPKDFGIVGLAFLVIASIDTLLTTGMKEALIQKKEATKSYLDTAWFVEVAKGLTILTFCLFVSSFFHHLAPAISWLTVNIIRFVGIFYFVQCLTNIGVIFFEKDIQFKNFFLYQFAGTIVDVMVSILAVQYLQTVWGLFYGILAGSSVRVLFSFILTAYKPSLSFSWEKSKELFSYGKWIFKSRIFNFIGLQSDSIIVSSFFNLYSLGLYQMAVRIGNLPMSQVSNIIGRIAFPTFSKVQDDVLKLKDYFLASINILSIALLPLIILVFTMIDDFVIIFLGIKWIEISPIVRVLILGGFLRIIVSLVDSLFCALGKPNFSSSLQLTRFLVFIISVPLLTYWLGILGIALSALLSLIVVLFIFLNKASRKIGIHTSEICTQFLVPIGFALLVGLIPCYLPLQEADVFNFIIKIILTLLLYLFLGAAITKYTSIKLFSRTVSLIMLYKKKL